MNKETFLERLQELVENYIDSQVVDKTNDTVKAHLKIALAVKNGETCKHGMYEYLQDGEIMCLYCGKKTIL